MSGQQTLAMLTWKPRLRRRSTLLLDQNLLSWKDTCSSFSRLFVASEPQASIGMNGLPNVSITWDFNPVRQSPTSGCGIMATFMSTLVSMWMTNCSATKDPKAITDLLQDKCQFKLKGTGPISFHLGCDFVRDEDGTMCMSPRKYIEKLLHI